MMASQNQAPTSGVFLSYSSIDRLRVNGLGLLLEGMGHRVFHDHRTIKPGMRWRAELQKGLDEADVLLIFWSRHAARSDWVRKEYEYFAANYPDRVLVPVLGDETPLSELLKTRQHADFAPVVNEVLEMKRRMKNQGADPKAIEQAVLERLAREGVKIKKKDRRWLFLFLGFGWLVTLLRYPGSAASTAGRAAVEKTAQVTVGQAAAIGAAALIGVGGSYPIVTSVARPSADRGDEDLRQAVGDLEEENLRLRDELAAGSCVSPEELGRHLEEIRYRLQEVAQCQEDVSNLRRELERRGGGGRVPPPEGEGFTRQAPEEPEPRPGEPGVGEPGYDVRPQTAPDRGGGEEPEPEADVAEPEIEFEPPDADGVFELPRLVYDPRPTYPRSARRSRTEGDVVVRGVIDERGRVSVEQVEAGDEPLQRALGDAAGRAIAGWRFEPGTLDGEPIPVGLTVRVRFRLQGVLRGMFRE